MTKKKRFKATAIMYGILAVICLISIKQLYMLFIFCAALCVINGYLAYKHKDDKPNPIIQKAADKIRINKRQSKEDKISRKKLKQEYKERLKEIEKEYDFDYDEEAFIGDEIDNTDTE